MAAQPQRIAPLGQAPVAQKIFAAMAGLFFFVSIIKFGDPVILSDAVQPPENAFSAIFESWQVKWGYIFAVPLIASGLAAIRWKELKFRWPLVLPVAWLGWQFLSATQSVSPALTAMTLKHFSLCVILFYLGYFGLRDLRNPWPLWTGLALALCWTLRIGLEQHNGGLEATRKMIESNLGSSGLPPTVYNDPAYLRRIASTRIFATFSNPDAFAGAIELLLPVTLLFLWQLTPKLRPAMRWLFVGILGSLGMACLFWTGSKGAWLAILIVAVIVLWKSTLSGKWKRGLITAVLVLGVAGFAIRYATNYKKQTVSVGTRVAYWKAALKIAETNPLLGTGPGTFAAVYPRFKQPEDDFAKLCHNDYLQQACDSGWPGFLLFGGMVVGCLAFGFRTRVREAVPYSIPFMVWIGTLGICLHATVEYHLYFPSLAWPLFFLLGFGASFWD